MDDATENIDRMEVMVDFDLAKRISNLPKSNDFGYRGPYICRLPGNPEITNYFFATKVISIGPYHHGKSCLAETERHKSRFLQYFLSRNANRSLEFHRNKLKMMEQKLRDDYVTKFNFTSDQFIDLILHDGCFVLEFLIKIYNHTPHEIFENESLLRSIKVDLLMVENQISLLVLEILRGDQHICTCSIPMINELVQYYFWEIKDDLKRCQDCSHQSLLHLYHQVFICPPLDDEKITLANPKGKASAKFSGDINKPNPYVLQLIPSAKELEKAGIVFKAKQTVSFLDITFHKGILEMPIIIVDKSFLLTFINLAMFEYHVVVPNRSMNAYCHFMSYLLRYPHDVAVLRKYGIIESNFMSDGDLKHLFYQLRQQYLFGRIIMPLYFVCLATDLCDFHSKSMITWRDNLRLCASKIQQMIQKMIEILLWWSFVASIIVLPILALASMVALIVVIVLAIKCTSCYT